MIIPIILCATGLVIPSLAHKADVLYEWNYLNFTWPNEAAYLEALSGGAYIPKNNVITGIKVWKDKVYLTVSRWKQGVPAALVSVPVDPNGSERAPLLQPYPNWEMQKLGDCSAMQFVQSMEIDPKGRMWVLENGRTEFMTEHPRTECPSRLIILDLENEGKILLDYQFPANVANRDTVFLNDIVVDHEDGGWAYISDNNEKYPGIVVFSLKDKKSWKVTHYPSMKAPSDPVIFNVDGKNVDLSGPIDGIALSPASSEGNRLVYYTALSSQEMFAIPARVLKNPHLGVKNHVKSVGRRSSVSDGLVITSKGDMYYGLLTKDAIFRWPISANVFTERNQQLVFHDTHTNKWPDTFAVDETGRLWWVANGLMRFLSDQVDITKPNYRVFFTDIKDKSYLYYNDFSSPKYPDVSS